MCVRQIEEAIWLYFEERDEVAIYTLAFAAHGVARDLAKHGGGTSFLGHPNDEHDLLGAVKLKANFAKHAVRDPAEAMTYPVEIAALIILDTIRTLVAELIWAPSFCAMAFFNYFACNHPEIVSGPEGEAIKKLAEFPVSKEKGLWLAVLRDHLGPGSAVQQGAPADRQGPRSDQPR